MILTDQLVGEDIAVVFPGVIGFGVSFPFDQILKSSPSPKVAMIPDGLDFVFLFSVDDIWGRSREVGSVLFRFLVRRQKAGVENVVYCPCRGEVQLVRHWRDDSTDLEWSVPFRG